MGEKEMAFSVFAAAYAYFVLTEAKKIVKDVNVHRFVSTDAQCQNDTEFSTFEVMSP